MQRPFCTVKYNQVAKLLCIYLWNIGDTVPSFNPVSVTITTNQRKTIDKNPDKINHDTYKLTTKDRLKGRSLQHVSSVESLYTKQLRIYILSGVQEEMLYLLMRVVMKRLILICLVSKHLLPDFVTSRKRVKYTTFPEYQNPQHILLL